MSGSKLQEAHRTWDVGPNLFLCMPFFLCSGGELLTIAYVLATLRTSDVFNILFLSTLALLILLAVFVGDSYVGHWIQFLVGMFSLLLTRLADISADQEAERHVKEWRNELLEAWHARKELNASKNIQEISEVDKDFVKSVLVDGGNGGGSGGNRTRSGSHKNKTSAGLRQRKK